MSTNVSETHLRKVTQKWLYLPFLGLHGMFSSQNQFFSNLKSLFVHPKPVIANLKTAFVYPTKSFCQFFTETQNGFICLFWLCVGCLHLKTSFSLIRNRVLSIQNWLLLLISKQLLSTLQTVFANLKTGGFCLPKTSFALSIWKIFVHPETYWFCQSQKPFLQNSRPDFVYPKTHFCHSP